MKSEKMMEDLKGLVTSFNMKEDDVRKKMAEWPGLLDKLKKLLADIDNANATAWEAYLDGENTLKKAMEMKDTLEVQISASFVLYCFCLFVCFWHCMVLFCSVSFYNHIFHYVYFYLIIVDYSFHMAQKKKKTFLDKYQILKLKV